MITDGNPFKKVLEMINKTITIIEAEEADDVRKKDTCIEEQETNEKNKLDKEVDIQTLESNIDSIEVAIEGTKESIELATEDLGLNRDSQKSTTATRTSAHAVFTETLSNCEDEEKAGKDAGGGNMERLEGLSVEELEAACSEKPECVGFNTAGWLKSSLGEESSWYDWDGGSLYVKMLNGVPAYESAMQALTASETTLLENIDTYKLDLASQEKQLE